MRLLRVKAGVRAGILLVLVPTSAASVVQTGADVLLCERLDLVRGARVGLITNQTGRLTSGVRLVDALLDNKVDVCALFSPEHGIRGDAPAGAQVADTVDVSTGVPVISLHGKARAPTPAALSRLDVMVYCIQDAGVRFYTYTSTMILAMEACAEQGVRFVVLDCPNPQGGKRLEGPLLEDSLRSFLGMLPVPVLYGLTPGELALMANGEGWLRGGRRADLTVVPLRGWARSMLWPGTGLPWRPPSPNLPGFQSAMVYPATCLLEATNVSEGRGTPRPFEWFGAPWVDGEALACSLSALGLPGIGFRPVRFTPSGSKHAGRLCGGAEMAVANPLTARVVETGLHILGTLHRLYPDSLRVDLHGLRRRVGAGGPAAEWMDPRGRPMGPEAEARSIGEFGRRAARYHLY
ncbi:MAG: DUF1343 domain-containing protein [Bacteroidota bacterium]